MRTELSVSNLDHNLLYIDNKTPDDHIYLQSAAKRFGVYVSRPGNGICHAIHTARFAVPGKVLFGGDSHTPHSGAVGMLYHRRGRHGCRDRHGPASPCALSCRRSCRLYLTGSLKPGVNAKDVILEMLRRVGVKGGLGRAFEYVGPRRRDA